ncbi:MAG: UDP-N-acetyl-D-glucosamine dehydrogenase, partial [Candidatus Omnitrophica bacterium]|nr:UDP-N-acetyl-D-glucosamine dehydrogenase [Candidatus Omnitrophota bacterium]
MKWTVSLEEKIKKRTAHCAVIGLGYVGLPFAVELAKAGYTVFGIDISKTKVEELKQGRSYIMDVPSSDIQQLVSTKKFKPTVDFSHLKGIDTVTICVPTPLRKTKEPDISYIVAAAREIKKFFHAGQLIVLESTTYPGTTEEVILPLLEAKGLKHGRDFYLCF